MAQKSGTLDSEDEDVSLSGRQYIQNSKHVEENTPKERWLPGFKARSNAHAVDVSRAPEVASKETGKSPCREAAFDAVPPEDSEFIFRNATEFQRTRSRWRCSTCSRTATSRGFRHTETASFVVRDGLARRGRRSKVPRSTLRGGISRHRRYVTNRDLGETYRRYE